MEAQWSRGNVEEEIERHDEDYKVFAGSPEFWMG